MTDSTGAAASGFQGTESGIKAGIGVAATKGLKIQYVMADTQSTPAGALAAAQKLVEQDHVFAILEVSSDFYGAAQYLFQQHIPVIGGGFDGPEWSTGALSNLFDVAGSVDYSGVSTTIGAFMKSQGVTKIGVVGYGVSATAREAAAGAAQSASTAGISIAYQNLNFPFGSTDVQPLAIAMKAAGVDGVYVPVVPSTSFALYAALLALGAKPKVFLSPTGYGGDLLQSPAGVQAAQGIDFETTAATVDLNTPGTKQFQAALKSYANVTTIPTFSEYEAYLAVAGLTSGLLKGGASPTTSSFMTALREVTDFDGFGLYGTHTLDFSQFGNVAGSVGPGDCMYVAKLSGSTFTTISGAGPICGTRIPGLKAST
ncbi:ABC transporter substrate-binding protein [Acidiferrimicrobium sp. IK]|nr:ABC transporter substrate-binding protein [Acidiferrimicrobium sp. IK]